MNTYEAYLNHPAGSILPIEEALQIYTDLVKSVASCTVEDKMEFYQDFLKKAVAYAEIRCDWEFMTREEKQEIDAQRTNRHNAFITAVNILSRFAENEGVDNSWREKLGEERKRIGDFACFTAYMTGIANR